VKGRNEDKVKFSAEHVRKELERRLATMKGLIIAGPAPAPLLRAETYYRHQLMLRVRHMPPLSRELNRLSEELTLPDDVSLTIDVDPMNMG
jgi:primosomal protein N' (replication factor Y)